MNGITRDYVAVCHDLSVSLQCIQKETSVFSLSYLQILIFLFFLLSRQKERDLELAARIGQSLLKQNQELTARNEMIDEQLEIAKEEVRREHVQHGIILNRPFCLNCAEVTLAALLPHPSDRSASSRAVHERRPPSVLRQHRGDRERRVTFTVSCSRPALL